MRRIAAISMVMAGIMTFVFAQSIPPQQISLTEYVPLKKGVLSAAWDSLRAHSSSGESFVFRQRIPEHPRHLVVFLNGGGSVGKDNYRQISPVMISMLESEAFSDTLILLPQCPDTDTWDSFRWDKKDGPYAAEKPSSLGEALIVLVTSLQEKYHIAKKDSLIWGISLGAFGLLDVITWHPEVFGKAISLAGGGDPTKLAYTQDLPDLWLIHGDHDTNVPPYHSQRIAEALSTNRKNVKLTYLPGANHGILDQVIGLTEFRTYLEKWALGLL